MTKILKDKLFHSFCLSSITQTIVTCAFSVQVCVFDMYSTDRQREGCDILYLLTLLCCSGGFIFGVFDCFCSKGHCFNARVTKNNTVEIFEGAAENVSEEMH